MTRLKTVRNSSMKICTLVIVAAGLILLGTPAGWAQNYPTRSVRIVVPFAPGGPNDVIARLVAQLLSTGGKHFYVENMPGAGGNTGVAHVARATPDGYTLLVSSTGFVVNPSLYAKVPYDAEKDFEAITKVAATPNVLAINPKIPADNVQQLAKLVASTPGKYNYAQPANGSTPHLSGELFRMYFNLDLPGIPFAGSAPAIASTIGGHTTMVFTSLPPAVGVIVDKKLKALAVTSAKRSLTIPDVPTMAEAGLSGQEAETWVGIWAPAKTPKPIVEFLNGEIAKALATPEVKAKLAAIAFEPVGNSSADFAVLISAELKKWTENIKKSGIPQIE